ncbi:hypothetical protein C8F01DRAFT_1348778 [Mycena amicta]|nr:hypothetical protein C8F01DRAFT_1348778 [Mycena amicta]
MSFRAALKRKKVATSATRYEHTIPFTPAGAVSDLNAPVNAAMTRVSADNRRTYSQTLPLIRCFSFGVSRRTRPYETGQSLTAINTCASCSGATVGANSLAAVEDVEMSRGRQFGGAKSVLEERCFARSVSGRFTRSTPFIASRVGLASTFGHGNSRTSVFECSLAIRSPNLATELSPRARTSLSSTTTESTKLQSTFAAAIEDGPTPCSAASHWMVSFNNFVAPHMRNPPMPRPLPLVNIAGQDYCIRLLPEPLESLTDATGVKPPDRYRIFLRISREYRHLLLLKRGGRGHASSGVSGTSSGELAIRCPACPRPDVNLPEDWENAPASKACAYVMFLALDACFRLKRRMISNEFKDPGLGTGWSYMVEWAPYREHLLKVVDQKEMSTCSGLAALDHANNKFSRGYSVTGVAMGVCARHEFVQPNGVADLQAGERYANMDWVFASILRHLHRRLRMLVSYDIACQWAKNLHERIATLPPMLKLTLVMALLRFAVPKLHIMGHIRKCQLVYSLNLIPGSGQTDGEGIERPWSMIGAVAASTRVSGPGSRADQLDDHWAFWNWKKLIGLAALLRRRLDVAIEEKARQEEAFAIFSAQQQERVPEWKVMVQTFEQNGEAKNPYEPVSKGLTELQLIGFILELLEAEIEQRRIAALVELKKAKSTSMKINLRRSRRRLNRRIATIRTLQATYSPVALQHLASLDLPQETLAEDVPLLPPSALTELQRSNGGCRAGLVELEATFREAQCRSALVSLRNHLHIKSRLLVYKTNQSRNQAANTRSRALVARNESKILLFSRKYQAAWAALVSISGGEAAVSWPRLRKADIRCLEDAEDLSKKDLRQKKAEEKKRRQERELRAAGIIPLVNPNSSMAGGDLDSDDESDDSMSGEALRIEWAKSWARVRRWTEEVLILEEEWRRLPLSFAFEEQGWIQRAQAVPVTEIPEEDAEGMIAYATKQADVYRNLATRAELTRTVPKLARGHRRARALTFFTSAAEIGTALDEEDGGDGLIERDDEGDEAGNVSDEELVMGGEVDEW